MACGVCDAKALRVLSGDLGFRKSHDPSQKSRVPINLSHFIGQRTFGSTEVFSIRSRKVRVSVLLQTPLAVPDWLLPFVREKPRGPLHGRSRLATHSFVKKRACFQKARLDAFWNYPFGGGEWQVIDSWLAQVIFVQTRLAPRKLESITHAPQTDARGAAKPTSWSSITSASWSAMSVAMFLSLVPPVARVTETVRAGSGANASRTPGSKRRVSGNPRVGPRRRGYTEFSVRTTGWRTTTTASSSSSTPSTRQDGMTRASLNANAAAARGTVGQSVGSRGAKKNEASLLKTETEKELFDEFEMEIEARHADTRGEESTPKLVRLPTGDAVAPWWHKGGSLPNVAEARSSREFMQRFAEAKVQSKTDGKKKLIVVEFLAGWCFACR